MDRRRRDPSASLVGFDEPDPLTAESADHTLTRTQKCVLVITVAAFGLMIFSVIPWSSIVGGAAGPAEYDITHTTEVAPYWFELNWWFPHGHAVHRRLGGHRRGRTDGREGDRPARRRGRH